MLRMYPAELHRAVAQLEQAAHDHSEWHEHLLRVIFCGQPCSPEDLSAIAHTRCDLGRWYYHWAPAELREQPSFEIIGMEHERLHRIATQLLRDVEADAPVVRTEFEDLVAASAGLRLALDSFRREIQAALLNRDELTGAYGRVELLPELRKWHDLARLGDRRCCIVLMDVDHLKAINDAHGYQVGDQVLVGSVRFLTEHLRTPDKVFRYAGSEFLISLPGADLESGKAVAARVREGLARELMIVSAGGVALHVTASFGIALLDPEVGVVDSVDRAEQALHLAKAAGRNRAISWDPSVTTGPRLRRLTVEDPQS
jgi:diguanylate cyclase